MKLKKPKLKISTPKINLPKIDLGKAAALANPVAALGTLGGAAAGGASLMGQQAKAVLPKVQEVANTAISGGPTGGQERDQRAQALAQQQQLASEAQQQQQEQQAIQDQQGKEQGLLMQQWNTLMPTFGRQDEERLNSMGILNSGALAEAKARRQGEMAGALAGNQVELTRAGLQRQFGLSDSFREDRLERDLSQQALREARSARKSRRRGALNSAIGGGLGAGAGALLGGPIGASIGYGVGSGVGGSYS